MEELKDVNPLDIAIDKEAEKKLYKDLAGVDGFIEYLREVMGQQIKDYFNATPEQQAHIKGAFHVLAVMRKKLIAAQKSLEDTTKVD